MKKSGMRVLILIKVANVRKGATTCKGKSKFPHKLMAVCKMRIFHIKICPKHAYLKDFN